MYESETFEVIMQRLLDRVPDDIDTREGSIIYDALAPVALEIAELYLQLDVSMDLFFAETAAGIYLDRKAADYGLTRKAATKTRRNAWFKDASGSEMDVPIGTRVGTGDVVFAALEKVSTGLFIMECETAGTVGNDVSDTILPIDNVAGLSQIEWSGLTADVAGTDEETDDALRERLLLRMRLPSASGNVADYIQWALSMPGVGAVKVNPVWNGFGGNVNVVILDTDKKPASDELVAQVQNYISPSAVNGQGFGVAPIGAHVYVEKADAVYINVHAYLTLAIPNDESLLAQVKTAFEAKITAYLKSIAFTANPDVKIAKIGAALLDIPGVVDYTNLDINGAETNVTISAGQVALLEVVELHA